MRGARGALLKRPAAGVCSECNLPRRRRERRETTFQSWLSGPITNDVPALPLTKSARPVGDTEKVAQEWLRGASGFERRAILPYQRATVSPQYWPFPASPGHRAANQKDREFVASSFGSADVAKFEVPLRRALSNGGSSSHPVEVASDFAFNNAKISQIRCHPDPESRVRAPSIIS